MAGDVRRPLAQLVGEVDEVGHADGEREAGEHQLVVGGVANVEPALALGIEIARSFSEALALIAEMGVVLKPAINSIYAARDFFREETRRK